MWWLFLNCPVPTVFTPALQEWSVFYVLLQCCLFPFFSLPSICKHHAEKKEQIKQKWMPEQGNNVLCKRDQTFLINYVLLCSRHWFSAQSSGSSRNWPHSPTMDWFQTVLSSLLKLWSQNFVRLKSNLNLTGWPSTVVGGTNTIKLSSEKGQTSGKTIPCGEMEEQCSNSARSRWRVRIKTIPRRFGGLHIHPRGVTPTLQQ